LRSDAPERAGVAIEPDFAADFHARRQLVGFGQRDLIDGILDLLFIGHDRLINVAVISPVSLFSSPRMFSWVL